VQSHCLRLIRGLSHAVYAYPEVGLVMKAIDNFISAVHKSSHEAAQVMSSQLRSEARASGWPEHVVRNMHVKYDSGKFTSHVHEAHAAEAGDLEYGTPNQRPTAAIRRASNRTQESEKFLIGRLAQRVGKL